MGVDIVSTNALTKAAERKRIKDPSLLAALKNGGPLVWISCLVMGFANIASGQIIMGLIYLAIEAGVFFYLFAEMGGLHWLSLLPSLGDRVQEEVYDEAQGVYVYVAGDDSNQILLYGVATLCIIALLIFVWQLSVRRGYKSVMMKKAGCQTNFIEQVKTLFDENIHKLLMILPLAGIAVFTILPLLYMMCMAFTNYNTQNPVLFDWVGLDNFKTLFNANNAIGKQFGSVLAWTLIWAFFATFLNFFLGTFVAIIINRKTIKCKGLFRGCLSLTIAIPQFVSLMLIRSMLMPQGIFNQMMLNAGLIDKALPFLQDGTWAKVVVIIVNLWVGIPYTIMQVTGILQNIPAEQYEAATIDGANAVQQFMNITLPYMIFVLTPYIITSFTGNINNFNVIYLLTRGDPLLIGNTAGETDLLVTWLYKLTVDQKNFNMGAVIGIFTFVVLAAVSLITYRSSGSYKDEEAFK